MMKVERNDADLEARAEKDEDNFDAEGDSEESGVSRRLISSRGNIIAQTGVVAMQRSKVSRGEDVCGKFRGGGGSVRSSRCCIFAALALVMLGMIGIAMLPRDYPYQDPELLPGENKAAVPAPRYYLPQWGWYHEKLKVKAQEDGAKTRILLLGDSIAEELLETSWGAPKPGFGSLAVWKEYYEGFGSLNLGMAGDQTQHLLWRLQNGELPDALQPESILLAIGTNNLGSGMDTKDTVGGIKAVVKYIHNQRPNALVCVMALFPRANIEHRMSKEPWSFIDEVNTRLEHLLRLGFSDGKIRFVNCNDRFLTVDEAGREVLNDRGIMHDNVHLTPDGLRMWAECVADDLRSGLSD